MKLYQAICIVICLFCLFMYSGKIYDQSKSIHKDRTVYEEWFDKNVVSKEPSLEFIMNGDKITGSYINYGIKNKPTYYDQYFYLRKCNKFGKNCNSECIKFYKSKNDPPTKEELKQAYINYITLEKR